MEFELIDEEPVSSTKTELTLPNRVAAALNSAQYELNIIAKVAASKDIVAVIDKAGREQAHQIAMELMRLRTGITKAGKASREDAAAFCKAVIAEESRLAALITPEETRILKLRDDYDSVIEAEKQAKIAAEKKRVADIREMIDNICNYPATMIGLPSQSINTAIESIEASPVTTEIFEEFSTEAAAAKAKALDKLDAMLIAALASEELAERQRKERKAEAERVKAQAAENARIKAELEARCVAQAKAIKDVDDMHAAQQAKLEAQQQKMREQQAELDRRQRELDAAEQERANAARIKQERIDVERQVKEAEAENVAQVVSAITEAVASIDAEIAQCNAMAEECITAAREVEAPTLTLGEISRRFELPVPSAFLAKLGFEPAAKVKTSSLFHESDWNDMCASFSSFVLSKVK